MSWDDYAKRVDQEAKKHDVSVIGVTDYMSVDGYEKLLAYRGTLFGSVDLLIPNIEFRALPMTTDGKALNIHLLVDPSDPQHIQKIRRALKNLKVKHGPETYGCAREELIEYARVQDGTLNEEAAYKFGLQQFKPSYQQIKTWLESEGWLRANSLFGISNGKDGISGLPLDGFAATRDDLLQLADLVLSGNPNDRLHYLGKKPGFDEASIKRQYRSLKPCIHGSDAHEANKLFVPDEDRCCWIKSDPTFEGLKQILWEPEARIHIGPTKPQLSDSSQTITSLNVSGCGQWFTQPSIPLSSGLVAIIGEKGSGKTAIADVVGFASGVNMDLASQSSFITKGRLHLGGGEVELQWGGGSKTAGKLTDQPFATQRPRVRYLSQDFVEQLCSTDHEGLELQQAIEEVVFSHLDEVHREGFSSFGELRAARESASQTRQDQFRGQLATLHREIERHQIALGQKPAKEASKVQAVKQLEELKKQLPAAEILADPEVLKKLEAERITLEAIETKVAALTRKRRSIEDFLKGYESLKERTDRQVKDLVEAASQDLPQELLSRLAPTWDSLIVGDLKNAATALDTEIAQLRGNAEATNPDGSSIADITARVKRYQESLSKDELNRKRLVDLQRQISAQEATIARLAKEIEDLATKITKQLTQRQTERDDLYAQYFLALAEDGKGLQELYAPMKEQLATLGEEMKFELSAGYHVNVKDWLERATRFYDGRKPAALSKKDEIEKHVAEHLAPALKAGDDKAIKAAMKSFHDVVSPVDFMEKQASPSLKLIELFDWMYSTDHIGTSYKIKYGGTELEYLSPGTRGIALLVLYLLMDEDDRRPLVIDQPEGNLDNSSIYKQLVPYIRKAKEKRQIILVTHNPNLVVATDAEQVIIATAERLSSQPYPQMTYISGSLEHSVPGEKVGIRQAVCTLLEGGETAFKERESRYSIQ